MKRAANLRVIIFRRLIAPRNFPPPSSDRIKMIILSVIDSNRRRSFFPLFSSSSSPSYAEVNKMNMLTPTYVSCCAFINPLEKEKSLGRRKMLRLCVLSFSRLYSASRCSFKDSHTTSRRIRMSTA